MEKTIRALTVAFYSVFILLIGYITLASLVADFSPLTLITLLLFLPGIYFIRRAIFKHDAFMLKHYKKLLFFFAAFMLILQIIFGCILRFDPVFDMDAIYGGAIEWVETGTFASYYDYYYYFRRNEPALYIFQTGLISGNIRFFYSGFNRQQHSIRMRHAHMFLNGQRAGRSETRRIYTRLFPLLPSFLFYCSGFLH